MKPTKNPFGIDAERPVRYINPFVYYVALGILLIALIVNAAVLERLNTRDEAVLHDLQDRIDRLNQSDEVLWQNFSQLQEQAKQDAANKSVVGIASWLDYQLDDSCAALLWPKGTALQVSVGEKSITCIVRDRGPYVPGRIVDLDREQFQQLADTNVGIIKVQVRSL